MEKFDEKALIERVKLIRIEFAGERGKSIFARAIGISPSTYNYYENDRVPPIDLLLRMVEVTKCELGWFLTGEKGENNFPGPNSGLLEMIDKLLSSDPGLAGPINAFIKLLDQKNGFEKSIRGGFGGESGSEKSLIPVLGRTAAGIVHCWGEEIEPGSKEAVAELNELVERYVGRTIVDSVSTKISVDLNRKGISGAKADLVQVNVDENDGIAEFVESADIVGKFPDCFALRLDAKRLMDFSQATEMISKASTLDLLLPTLLTISLKQFAAFRAWCALRTQPNGPMTFHAGKRRDGQRVELDQLSLKDKITQAVDKKQSLVLPRVSAQIQETDHIRSAMIAPIIQSGGCLGVIYIDNSMVHEHYSLSDLDYLMLLSIHTVAFLKKLL